MVVDRIVNVLANPLPSDHAMEGTLSDNTNSSDESDVDMVLSHFQNEAKLEALARRDSSKSGTTPLKRRMTPNS